MFGPFGRFLRVADRADRFRKTVPGAPIASRLKLGDQRRITLGALRLWQAVPRTPVRGGHRGPLDLRKLRVRVADRAERLWEAVLAAPVAPRLEHRDEPRVALGAQWPWDAVLAAHSCRLIRRPGNSFRLLSSVLSYTTASSTASHELRDQEYDHEASNAHGYLPVPLGGRTIFKPGLQMRH